MKTILAIINEPDESRELIEYVIQLAADLKLNIHLLNVQHFDAHMVGVSGTGGGGMATIQIQKNLEELAKKADKTMAEISKKVANDLRSDINISHSSEIGITISIIEELVSSNKVDMVVVESNNKDGLWSQEPDNIDVIRNIKCPVWVLPNKPIYKPFYKIVYATDYKEEDISTLKKLIDLTKVYSPEIIAFHITDAIDFHEKVNKTGFLQMVKEKTGYDKVSVKTFPEKSFSGDDIALIINDYAIVIDANLIVTLKENRHFLDRIFKSSATNKIIKNANLPVLVYHEKK